MAIRGPWYITRSAIEQYLRIRSIRETDESFERAERDLSDLARRIVEAGKPGTELNSGAYQFRGPRPLRLRLIVSYARRAEGDLPQLIEVKPDHEGRSGSYERSRGVNRTRGPSSTGGRGRE